MASNYLTRTAKRKAKKTAKKNPVAVVVAVLCLVVFLGAGMATGWLITKNDKFELVDNNKQLTLDVGGVYTEKGANIVAFGVDLTKYLVIEIFDSEGEPVNNIDTSVDSSYAIVYSLKITDDPNGLMERFAFDKYKNFKQVRYITVGEGA
ncbi:MAG: hypothetical protein J6B16_01725 [Clostridia bacterium]|nr:hypothetical protein [Clostridia bacterium]